jgi:hypothetical protein
MTSWLLLALATLGVLRLLPIHLHLASTSHLSTSDQLWVILIPSVALSNTAFYPTASGSLLILQNEPPPFTV